MQGMFCLSPEEPVSYMDHSRCQISLCFLKGAAMVKRDLTLAYVCKARSAPQ